MESNFPGAASHVRAAQLRSELYNLVARSKLGTMTKEDRRRYTALVFPDGMNKPARLLPEFRVAWFIKLCVEDFGSGMETLRNLMILRPLPRAPRRSESSLAPTSTGKCLGHPCRICGAGY
jgi:hypothetical protein